MSSCISWRVELTVECHECGDEFSEFWCESIPYGEALSDCLAEEGWSKTSSGEILCEACCIKQDKGWEDDE
jgi:hypothetical protein